ncbi:MAG: DUF192 domain-containing protein [Patescibacteria group bacterium]
MKANSKLSKFNLIILALFAVSVVGLKIWQYHWSDAVVEIKGEQLRVLVAKTPYQQKKGLGKRDSLGEYQGMLFVFSLPGRIAMVMRDMKFPIDIVWLNGTKVIDIAPNVQTEDVPEEDLAVYYPRKAANLVLELPAGWAEEHDLRIGDVLTVVQE